MFNVGNFSVSRWSNFVWRILLKKAAIYKGENLVSNRTNKYTFVYNNKKRTFTFDILVIFTQIVWISYTNSCDFSSYTIFVWKKSYESHRNLLSVKLSHKQLLQLNFHTELIMLMLTLTSNMIQIWTMLTLLNSVIH
jgi:hypothetical protein